MKNKLLKNMSLLFVVQGSNYLLPLLAFPYLVRTLGVENFGLLSLAIAMVNYFKIMINYGFDLSATKEIAEHRDNHKKVEGIFNSVFLLKIIFFIISFILFSIVVFSFEKFSNYKLLYYFTFIGIIGDILLPIWFFQGFEKMKFIAYLNFISKGLFLVTLFTLVKDESDLLIVPILTAFGSIVAGISALYIIKFKFHIKFHMPNLHTLVYHLKEGWYMFLGLFNMSIVNNSVIFILGIFTSNNIVGHYAIAEKFIRAIKNMTSPISQAVYPYLANMYKKDAKEAYKFSLKLSLLVSLIMLFVSIILIVFAKNILILLFTENKVNEVSILTLQILSFFPLISSFIHIYCTQNMIFLEMKTAYAKVFFIATIFNLLAALIFIPIYNYIAGAILIICTEILIGIIMSCYIYRRIKNDR